MFYRTVELIQDKPLRIRGGPSREIQESCRPWLFQAASGSYQFAVALQEAKQLDFFRKDVRPDLVAHQFLSILRATASEDLQEIETAVRKPEYRNVFLKLSRNLAPTGKTFASIELRAGTGDPSVALTPEARATINQSIRNTRQVSVRDATESQKEFVGSLRAVDLDKDFLDIVVEGQTLHVVGLGDAMDDVIGPMVNTVGRAARCRPDACADSSRSNGRSPPACTRVAGSARAAPSPGPLPSAVPQALAVFSQ
jgi:hypothetical protein